MGATARGEDGRSDDDQQHENQAGDAVTDPHADAAAADTPTADTPAPVAHLRHEAGLTAGQTLPLNPGRFRFGPLRSNHGGLVSGTPDVVSFDLTVADDGSALLTAGPEPVAVEGVRIDRPVTLDDGDVVQLATDHFVIETSAVGSTHPPRRTVEPHPVDPTPSPGLNEWLALFGAITLVGVVAGLFDSRLFGLALLGLAGIVGTMLLRSRRQQQLEEAHRVAVDNARSLFFSELVAARKQAAQKLRLGTNTPASIATRAVQHQAASSAGQRILATIASGDRGWEPPVVVHRDPGWAHAPIVDELSFLPAIPYTVDLDAGPLGIVGPRAATLAVARHLATTALAVDGGGAGISTDVPADWRWLSASERTSIRILDDVGGTLGARTVALAGSVEALDERFSADVSFSYVLMIDADGRATIAAADGGGGSGFVPHGITTQHAQEIWQQLAGPGHVIDLRTDGPSERTTAHQEPEHGSSRLVAPTVDRSNLLGLEVFDTERMLVTGRDRSKNRDVLATAALRQAGMHPDRALYILDRGDRALIRLAQLDSCTRYVTFDQTEGVDQLIWDLAAATADPDAEPGLLLAPDLWSTIAFYRGSGHGHLADRIDAVVAKMERTPMAASASSPESATSSAFLVWMETTDDDLVEVRRPQGNGVVDLRSLPGVDLTGSVARLKHIPTEEIRP